MVRRKFVLLLAMLVAAQVVCAKGDDDENEYETKTNTDDDDDDNDEEEMSLPTLVNHQTSTSPRVSRTTNSRPLQCYVCSYKRDSSERNCLDPLHHNVTSVYCLLPRDKCFTAMETRGSGVSIAVRGCKTDCISSPDIICCGTDRCNSHPVGQPSLRTVSASDAGQRLPQTILYFVTVLLLLQAVVKVNIV